MKERKESRKRTWEKAGKKSALRLLLRKKAINQDSSHKIFGKDGGKHAGTAGSRRGTITAIRRFYESMDMKAILALFAGMSFAAW